MIRCLAIDDEPLALRQLAAYIQKIPYLELAGSCPSALEAKKILDREVIDALFIDINMPDLNGMSFVQSLASPPLVVFTTAYSEYAVEGYKVNAVDYLLKPFGLDEFKRAAQKVKKQYELEAAGTAAPLISPPPSGVLDYADTIFLKTEHRVVKVAISDITYVEGMSEYLKIHLEGQKTIVALLAMKRLEERLPSTHFMRIHRSYLINLQKIKEVNKNRVILDRETFLPIGDLYREAFLNYLQTRVLSK